MLEESHLMPGQHLLTPGTAPTRSMNPYLETSTLVSRSGLVRPSLMIIASAFQFHNYLPFSIVS